MRLLNFFEGTSPENPARLIGEPTDLLVRALEEIENLPELKDWWPENPHLYALSLVMRYGVPLALVSGQRGFESIRAKVGAALQQGVSLGKVLAELNVAAFLVLKGGSVRVVPRSPDINVRTPDLQAEWGKILVDIEVIRGEKRLPTLQAETLVRGLAGAIGVSTEPFDIVIYCAHDLDAAEQDAILRAVIGLTSGDCVGAAGRWQVEAVADGLDADRYRPSWWPGGPSHVATHVALGAVARRLHVRSTVSPGNYYESVRRKAERSQRTSPDLPFVIALDVLNFPASEAIVAQLSDWLPLWPHVSGVLLLDAWDCMTEFCFKSLFIANDAADIPAPEALFALSRNRMGSDILPYEMPSRITLEGK